MDTRDSASIDVVFRTLRLRRRSDFRFFHGSMSCLHVPLSTLREQPCDCPRMTRSRCGSLGLHRMALSSTPSRRIIPAHLKANPNGMKTSDSGTVLAQGTRLLCEAGGEDRTIAVNGRAKAADKVYPAFDAMLVLGRTIQRGPRGQRVHVVSPVDDLSVLNGDNRNEPVVIRRTGRKNLSVHFVLQDHDSDVL
jgi:hypothetical protein